MEDSTIQNQNPYAPPVGEVGLELLEQNAADALLPENRRSWLGSLAVWSLVCIVSAIPSFVWGLGTIASTQAAAMVLGIVIFIVGYVFVDQLTQPAGWRRNRSLRMALKIGYITRLAISVIFPVGGFLDMICGMFSFSIVDFASSIVLANGSSMEMGAASFGQVLATTLVQGVVLNVVLSAYVLLVFGIMLVVNRGVK